MYVGKKYLILGENALCPSIHLTSHLTNSFKSTYEKRLCRETFIKVYLPRETSPSLKNPRLQ